MKKIFKEFKILILIIIYYLFFYLFIKLAMFFAPKDSFISQLTLINWIPALIVFIFGFILIESSLLFSLRFVYKNKNISSSFKNSSIYSASISMIIALSFTLNTDQFTLVTSFIAFLALFTFLFKNK